MSLDEEDVKIPVVAEADTTGFDETQAAAAKTADKVADAAAAPAAAQQEEARRIEEVTTKLEEQQQAAQAPPTDGGQVAETRRQAAAAAQDEAAASAEVQNAMRYETMSKKELLVELQKLNAARSAAAKAKDGAAYQQLAKQTEQAKKRLGELDNEGKMNQLVLIGQAQAGMQAADSIKALAAGAADGSLSVGDMVTKVAALGMTMKAALGPMGLVMAAVQGLQMAMTAYTEAQKEAAAAQKEFAAAAQKQQENVAAGAEKQQQRELKNIKEATDTKLAELDRERRGKLEAFDAAEAARKSHEAAELTIMREGIDRRIAEQEALFRDKKISAAELAAFRAREEEKYRIAVQSAEQQTRDAEQKRLDLEEKYANKELKEREKEAAQIADAFRGLTGEWEMKDAEGVKLILDQIDSLATRRDVATETVANINAEIEALKKTGKHWYGNDEAVMARIAELRKDRWRAEQEAKDATDRIGKIEKQVEWDYQGLLKAVSWHKETEGMSIPDRLRWAQNVQEAAKTSGEALDEARLNLKTAQDTSQQHRNENAQQVRINKAKEETAQAAEERAKTEAEKADREKRIADEFQKLETETKLRGSYAVKDARSEEEIAAADRATLDEKLRRLRALLATPGLDAETYRKLNKAVADTVASQKAIEATLRKSSVEKLNKQLERQLGKLVEDTKTTGTYEEEDKRTRRQILNTDKERLARREKELRAMRATADLDPTLAEKIDKELDAVAKQSRGLEQAIAANRKASSKWLHELKPPQLQAKNKMVQRALDATAKQYARTAENARKAAEKGDTKALDRYRRSLQGMAKQMDRRAKDSSAGTRLWKQTDDALRACTAEAKAQKTAAKQSTRQGKRKAASDKKAADNATRAANETKPEAAKKGDTTAKLASDVSDLKAQVQRLETAQSDLNKNIGSLATAVSNLATATEETASAASDAAQAAGNAVSTLQGRLGGLQKQVDRIQRKMS